MSKKKKNKSKIVKLTDEQYNAYIMALKDEKPPHLVQVTQEDKWQNLIWIKKTTKKFCKERNFFIYFVDLSTSL